MPQKVKRFKASSKEKLSEIPGEFNSIITVLYSAYV